MTIAMYQSSILAPHRPRRYGLLQVADVRWYEPDTVQRWVAGVDAIQFTVDAHNVDLTACDPPVTGFFDYERNSETPLEFRAFTSVTTANWSTLCGPDASNARVQSMRDEHYALLPYLLDVELILGQIRGSTTGSLSDLATRDDPSADLSGAGILSYAEDLARYDSIIMVPLGAFADIGDGVLTREDGVWRTLTGNAVVPHAAGEDVYVIPAPLVVRLVRPEVFTWVDHTNNTVEATSTVLGLFEFSPDVYVFDPQGS